jgi:biotin carboxylase
MRDGVIVKPIIGGGGFGVRHIPWSPRFLDELADAIRGVAALQRSSFSPEISVPFIELDSTRPITDYILVEEYLNGEGYSLEGYFSRDGQCTHTIEQRKTISVETPSFRDLEYIASTNCDQALLDTVRFTLTLVGLFDSPFHIELKRTPSGVKLIEVNPRTGGGSIADLLRAIYSVNLKQFGTDSLAKAIGLANCKFATSVIQPQQLGRILKYKGIDEVRAQPDCVFLRILTPEGSTIWTLDTETYLVEFCVVGTTESSTLARCRELARLIHIEIEL